MPYLYKYENGYLIYHIDENVSEEKRKESIYISKEEIEKNSKNNKHIELDGDSYKWVDNPTKEEEVVELTLEEKVEQNTANIDYIAVMTEVEI